jgi:hypothetical protein
MSRIRLLSSFILIAIAGLLVPRATAAPPQPCTIAQGAYAAICYGTVLTVSPRPVVVGKPMTLTVDPTSGYQFDTHTIILLEVAPNAWPYSVCGVSQVCPVTGPHSLTVTIPPLTPPLQFRIVAENHNPVNTATKSCVPPCSSAQSDPVAFVLPPPPPAPPVATTQCPQGQVRQSDGKCRPQFPLADAGGTIVYRCNNVDPDLGRGYGQGVLTTHPEFCWPLDRFEEGSATDTRLRIAPGHPGTQPFGPGSTPVYSCNNFNTNLATGYGLGVLTTHPEFCGQHPNAPTTDTLLRVPPGPAAAPISTSGTAVYVCNNFNPRGAAYGLGVLTTQPQFCAPFPQPATTDTLLRVQ